MSACRQRGGAPVGHLAELPPLEAAAVRQLRLWRPSRARRERPGGAEERPMNALFDLVHRHARRPLIRHCVECPHVGGDEAAFAQFVAAAAAGDREDAILLATLIFRADMAFIAVVQAEEFGRMLLRTRRRPQRREFHAEPGVQRTLH